MDRSLLREKVPLEFNVDITVDRERASSFVDGCFGIMLSDCCIAHSQ